MAILARQNHLFNRLFERHEAFSLTVALGFPIVALDQFLHTSPAQFAASPTFQLFRWVGDTLIALPLVAAAVWAGQLIAGRAGLGWSTRREVFQRALLISGLLALFLIPGWFIHNEVAGMTQSADLIASHSHAASHNPDAYWVADPVVYGLLLAPLAVMSGWAGYRIAARLRGRPARSRMAGRSWAAAVVVAVVVGGAAAGGWFLHEAANRADSSRVLYTGASQSALIHSHAFFAKGHSAQQPAPASPATGAPFSFAYQVARAFQDGLIAQSIGLPVAVLVLLWAAWLLRGRNPDRPDGFDKEEVATP
jgi:hypothetical protein